MKNNIKLQILVSEKLNKKLIQKINKTALKENNKAQGISEYVRNLIIEDVEKNNG